MPIRPENRAVREALPWIVVAVALALFVVVFDLLTR